MTTEQIRARLLYKPWVSPYERIVMTADERAGMIEIIEYHARNACYGGAAWETHHYKKTSGLIIDSKRDGVRNVFKVKIGHGDLDLIPCFAAAGIESAEVRSDQIRVTYAGLAGAGVAVAMCRGLAKGVKEVEVHSWGGGDQLGRATVVVPKHVKVIIGIDDTDKPGEGATWALSNEIAYKLGMQGFPYLNHSIVQLYPKNQNKTTNGVSIAVSFASEPGRVEELINTFANMLKDTSSSQETAIAAFTGIDIPKVVVEFGERSKIQMVSIEDAEKVAKKGGVRLISITGERGKIGALAAIAYADLVDEAVVPGIKLEG